MIVHSYVKKTRGYSFDLPRSISSYALPSLDRRFAFAAPRCIFADHQSVFRSCWSQLSWRDPTGNGGPRSAFAKDRSQNICSKKKRETIALVKDGVLMTHTIDQNRYWSVHLRSMNSPHSIGVLPWDSWDNILQHPSACSSHDTWRVVVVIGVQGATYSHRFTHESTDGLLVSYGFFSFFSHWCLVGNGGRGWWLIEFIDHSPIPY